MTNAFETLSIPMPDTELPADPFMSDVFGSNGHVTASDPQTEPEEDLELLAAPADWTSRLPKVSRKQLAPSFVDEKIPDQLPGLLCTAIEDALHEVVFAGSGKIKCQLDSIAECDLSAEVAASSIAGSLALPIVFERAQAHAIVLVGGGFVHRVIDEIFGPSGHESSNKVSPIEIAITEFLAAKVVGKINDRLGDNFFSVGEASLMPTDLFSEDAVGAKARLEVQGEDFSQLFPVLISQRFFSGIKNIAGISDSEPDERKAAKLFRTIGAIPVRAQIGSTRLDSATLSFLEPGDIVIVEEPQISWNNGSPKGELRVLGGVGVNFAVTGEITTNKSSGDDRIRLLVKDISSREAVEDRTARLIMEDKNTSDTEPAAAELTDVKEQLAEPSESTEISAAVENLQLRLRVELAGSRMSLREINDLRVGQVIDLGRGPTDAVSLITDGSDETVAVGELVDIDGSLGVRLTKVFL